MSLTLKDIEKARETGKCPRCNSDMNVSRLFCMNDDCSFILEEDTLILYDYKTKLIQKVKGERNRIERQLAEDLEHSYASSEEPYNEAIKELEWFQKIIEE